MRLLGRCQDLIASVGAALLLPEDWQDKRCATRRRNGRRNGMMRLPLLGRLRLLGPPLPGRCQNLNASVGDLIVSVRDLLREDRQDKRCTTRVGKGRQDWWREQGQDLIALCPKGWSEESC
jgi:hypothetical protein